MEKQLTFDAAWKLRATDGDAQAMHELVDASLEPLFRFCFYRVGRNRHLCEEVVQETIIRAIAELASYQPERSADNILPWLTGLARNEIRRALSREPATASLETIWARMDEDLRTIFSGLESSPLADDVLGREETREMVNATMSQLPEHYREALEAKYVSQRSVREIATQRSTSEKAIDVVVGLFDEGESTGQASERSRFSTVEHEGLRYLVLRFRPELETAKQRERRDWVFFLEADGSRDPLLARVQVDIVKTLLENAEHDDTFSIVTAGTRVHAFAASQQPATTENIAAAVAFLNKTHLIGALNLEQAIAAAGNYVQAADRPLLVHVGSGIPILGEREIGKLVESLSKDAPYVGVGVGKRWNRQFMKAAASRTGGYFTQINPDESIKWRAFELVSSLNTPRLLDIRVEADNEQGEFLAMKDWVSHGEEICAVARLQPGQTDIESVTVSGSINGNPYRRTIPARKVEEGAEYLPRMWAKLAIDEMVARDAETNKSRIIELSKSMYVMSPFTSLLVLENDAMYEQYNVDRGRKDHWALYPCPDKIEVVHEPLQGPQPAVTSDRSDEPKKPSLEEVLRTLLVRTSDFGYGTLATVNRLPTFSSTTFSSTVSVPDGGTVLLGGIKRLREAQTELGVPMLSNLPYLNRLFRNGRSDGYPLMLMVTPRITIQEEEEELLGILIDPG